MSNTNWSIDNAHSEIHFKVKHMMISTVTGGFNDFTASVTSEDQDFSNATFKFSTSIDSITTNNADRDAHLKSPDFFDAPTFPNMTFEGKGFDGKTVHGNLTIKGKTLPVVLSVEHGGVIKDPYGLTRTGFEITAKINRKDFGLTWSSLTEAGGLVLSDDIKISANVEFVQQ